MYIYIYIYIYIYKKQALLSNAARSNMLGCKDFVSIFSDCC